MKEQPTYLKHPRLYRIHAGMIDRCLNPKNENFHNYGGRGIVVCLKWIKDKNAFIEWALANGYQENLTIDRIDVNGGYNPENCRWATVRQQAQNKRNTRYITYKGEQRKIIDWCELLNLDFKVVNQRIFLCGWEAEDAFNPDLNHKPKEYTFQGKRITATERANLLDVYRKIINDNFYFYDPGYEILTKKERIKRLAEKLDAELFFFEFDHAVVEKIYKITNSAA